MPISHTESPEIMTHRVITQSHVGAGHALLVDDDLPLLRACARVLARAGFEVTATTTGGEAVALVRKGPPFDVILSDISMPDLDGVALLREVRRLDPDARVVLMTGGPTVETAMQAVELGALRYLPKPVEPALLVEVATRAVQLRRQARLQREAVQLARAGGVPPGARSALEDAFESALERLWMAFQPIVRWSERRVVGYEALLRSDEPSLASPLALIDAAERLGRIHDLGRAVRREVGRRSVEAPEGALLFVNVHPLELGDPELYAPSAPLGGIARRVVFEVTERASMDGVGDLAARVAALRGLGYRVALDDLGAGYAGLANFTRLEPDYVKLDRELVQGLDRSSRKRSVVRATLRLCVEELGVGVVGEGVESAEELEALVGQGCDLLQGFFLARPGREFAPARLVRD